MVMKIFSQLELAELVSPGSSSALLICEDNYFVNSFFKNGFTELLSVITRQWWIRQKN